MQPVLEKLKAKMKTKIQKRIKEESLIITKKIEQV